MGQPALAARAGRALAAQGRPTMRGSALGGGRAEPCVGAACRPRTVGIMSSWNWPVVSTLTSDDLPAFCSPISDSSISRLKNRLQAPRAQGVPGDCGRRAYVCMRGAAASGPAGMPPVMPLTPRTQRANTAACTHLCRVPRSAVSCTPTAARSHLLSHSSIPCSHELIANMAARLCSADRGGLRAPKTQPYEAAAGLVVPQTRARQSNCSLSQRWRLRTGWRMGPPPGAFHNLRASACKSV